MGGAFVGRLGLSTRPVLCIHVHSLQQLSQACWRLMSGCLARTRCGTCTIGAVPLARAGPRARVRSAAVCIGPRPGVVTAGRPVSCGVSRKAEPDRKPNRRKAPKSGVGDGAVWLTSVAMDPCHSTSGKTETKRRNGPPARRGAPRRGAAAAPRPQRPSPRNRTSNPNRASNRANTRRGPRPPARPAAAAGDRCVSVGAAVRAAQRNV